MTAHLPPVLLSLFAARPPTPFLPPPEKKPYPALIGLAPFLERFETAPPPPKTNPESVQERRTRVSAEKEEKKKKDLEDRLSKWDPKKENPNHTGEPYHTLFVGRLSYNISESKLKREFEIYGPVKRVRIVNDRQGKPRGYAFVEFEKERDLKTAWRQADGKKIDGRRVVVDVERGRTTPGFKPRYLGGGLGFTRKGPEEVNQKYSGREQKDNPNNEKEQRSPSPPRDKGRERDSSYSEERRGGGGNSDRRSDRDSRGSNDRRRERDSRHSSSSSSSHHRSDRDDRDRSSRSNRRERSRDRE